MAHVTPNVYKRPIHPSLDLFPRIDNYDVAKRLNPNAPFINDQTKPPKYWARPLGAGENPADMFSFLRVSDDQNSLVPDKMTYEDAATFNYPMSKSYEYLHELPECKPPLDALNSDERYAAFFAGGYVINTTIEATLTPQSAGGSAPAVTAPAGMSSDEKAQFDAVLHGMMNNAAMESTKLDSLTKLVTLITDALHL